MLDALPARLTRKQAAEFLTAKGFPASWRYFEKLCVPSTGKGPRIDCWFGERALYRPADLIAWAEARARSESRWREVRRPRRAITGNDVVGSDNSLPGNDIQAAAQGPESTR